MWCCAAWPSRRVHDSDVIALFKVNFRLQEAERLRAFIPEGPEAVRHQLALRMMVDGGLEAAHDVAHTLQQDERQLRSECV